MFRADCSDIPSNYNGIYEVNLATGEDDPDYNNVYCDMEQDGGGWTVIMRRQNGSVDFHREWDDYKHGFGSLTGEFWAGNEIIHKLTTNGKTFSLRIDLMSFDEEHIFAEYRNFSLGPEHDNYRLYVSGYSSVSTAGDSLSYHDKMMFSTFNRDNDQADSNCADRFYTSWWFNRCYAVLLTGQYGRHHTMPRYTGIVWLNPWGLAKHAQRVIMKITPN